MNLNTQAKESIIFKKKVVFGQRKIIDKRIILFATNPKRILSAYDTTDLPEVLMRSVLEAIKKVKDAHLIIKIHPYDENCQIYKRLIKELKVRKLVTVIK